MVSELAAAIDGGCSRPTDSVHRQPNAQKQEQPDRGCEVTCRGQVEGKAMQEYGQGICCAHYTFGRNVEGYKTKFGRHKMTTKLM